MWLPVFSFVVWLLDRTQHDIATLALATHGRTTVSDGKTPRVTGRLAIATLACYLTDNYFFAIVSLLAGCIQYIGELWYQQEQFATIDRETKEKPKKTDFIMSANRPSGWANDPELLKKLPKFLTSRRLTSLTLVELAVLAGVTLFFPDKVSLGLTFTLLAHYITDALDGAVGRFNKEGYVLWGYYVDHSFDTLYEIACMTAMWYVTPGDAYLALIGILAMAITVHAFHRKELIFFEKKLSTTYTNVMNGMPLHYMEWAGAVLGVVLYFIPIPWEYVTAVVGGFVSFSASKLVWWHIENKRENKKE